MLADLPKPDNTRDVNQRFLDAPNGGHVGLVLCWHQLHQVYVANFDYHRGHAAEAKENTGHDKQAVCQEHARVKDLLNDHTDPEETLSTMFIGERWEPEKCSAPANED